MDIQTSATSVRSQRVAAAAVDYIIYQIITFIAGLVMVPFIGVEALMDATLGILEGETPNQVFIQYSIVTTLIGLLIGIVYYGWIPTKKNGQTIGKKFLHVRAADENGENLPFSRHLARAVMLYGLYLGTPALLLIAIDYGTYSTVNTLLSFLTFSVVVISIILLLTRPDAKGLHDMLAHSYVVDEYYKMDENMQQKKEDTDPLAFDYDAWEDKDDSWS